MKIPYSAEFNPPAPVLMIDLALRDQSPLLREITALVDSGADMTIIPTDLIEELDAPQLYSARMRAFATGSIRPVSIHQVDIIVNNSRIPSVEVISDDLGDQVILGRNFLNKFRMILDGPNLVTDI